MFEYSVPPSALFIGEQTEDLWEMSARIALLQVVNKSPWDTCESAGE